MKKQKDLILLIQQIANVLCQLKQKRLKETYASVEKFDQRCREFLKATHPFYLAVERQWFGAAKRVEQRLNVISTDFMAHLQKFKEHLVADEVRLPSPGEIFGELRQIEDEFGQLDYNLEEGTLTVATEPIVLEGVTLGAFEIELTIKRMLHLYEGSPYRIIALNPNPAGNNENVTHPHVSDEYLCEGDGIIPIRKALQEGRICDFFMMIAQILNTYNPGSPYVALNDWEGTPCYDCGYTVSDDDSYYCEDCNRDFCSECSSYCKVCDTTICRSCLSECPDCQEPVCNDCFQVCRDCERRVCTDCLEENLCYVCIENGKEDEDEETIQTTTEQPVPAVQSNGVGETRISA